MAPKALDLVVSVVSHGDAGQVRTLLERLAEQTEPMPARVVVTWNIPEAQAPGLADRRWPFELIEIRNHRPKGFGANHNQALAGAAESFVGVLNPDVSWSQPGVFDALCRAAGSQGVGCAYPAQRDASGQPQDHVREVPTPVALWRRHMRGQADRRAEWVNAACWVVPSGVWRRLGGFDEAYHLYCEDVDFCLRVRRAHLGLAQADAMVVHEARRASRRHWRHFTWHVTSLLRLWTSAAFWWAVGDRRRAMANGRAR